MLNFVVMLIRKKLEIFKEKPRRCFCTPDFRAKNDVIKEGAGSGSELIIYVKRNNY